jgi:3-oxoadipate CoA-transferase, beta subunit
MTKRLSRNQMAWRAAQDVAGGSYVNLGIGIPILVANYIPEDRSVMLQSENGILGIGPAPAADEIDPYFVDAGAQFVSLAPGGMLTDSVGAFTMITGGHIDVTLLGAFQVAGNGDFANWDAKVPNKGPLVGGAMDLAAGAKDVRLIMAHTTRDGEPRLVAACAYPLTARGRASRIYTDLAVVDVTRDGFVVREMVDGIGRDALAAKSGAPLAFASDCKTLAAPDLED